MATSGAVAGELIVRGTVVNKAWAASHEDILKRLLEAHTKSVAWFYDDANRREAIRLTRITNGSARIATP